MRMQVLYCFLFAAVLKFMYFKCNLTYSCLREDVQTVKQCMLVLVFHAVCINQSKSFYCNYSFSSATKKRLVSFANTATFDVHV